MMGPINDLVVKGISKNRYFVDFCGEEKNRFDKWMVLSIRESRDFSDILFFRYRRMVVLNGPDSPYEFLTVRDFEKEFSKVNDMRVCFVDENGNYLAETIYKGVEFVRAFDEGYSYYNPNPAALVVEVRYKSKEENVLYGKTD